MDSTPQRSEEPRASFTFDAIPEDDERQEELNRTMRKPGEPPYYPPGKKPNATGPQPGDAKTEK